MCVWHQRNEASPVIMNLESGYEGVKVGSHTVEDRISMPSHRPHVTSQPSLFSHLSLERRAAVHCESQAILHHPTFGFASPQQQFAKTSLVACKCAALEVLPRCVRLHVMVRAGCIFTGWTGSSSPLVISGGTANVRNTAFINMDTSVEIVDISERGLVRLENVILANVTLRRGYVVSTTLDDDAQLVNIPKEAFSVTETPDYFPSDDAVHDVPITSVPAEERGVFREEWRIDTAAMLNCLPWQAEVAEVLKNSRIRWGYAYECTAGLPDVDIPDDYNLAHSQYPPWAVQHISHLLRRDDRWLCMTRNVRHLATFR